MICAECGQPGESFQVGGELKTSAIFCEKHGPGGEEDCTSTGYEMWIGERRVELSRSEYETLEHTDGINGVRVVPYLRWKRQEGMERPFFSNRVEWLERKIEQTLYRLDQGEKRACAPEETQQMRDSLAALEQALAYVQRMREGLVSGRLLYGVNGWGSLIEGLEADPRTLEDWAFAPDGRLYVRYGNGQTFAIELHEVEGPRALIWDGHER